MGSLALPLLALMAGIVSFSSPCCLPLLPGYPGRFKDFDDALGPCLGVPTPGWGDGTLLNAG